MYFQDLSKYRYRSNEPSTGVLNIGWLSREHSFPTGEASKAFIECLRQLAASPIELTRGAHICEFFPEPPVFLSRGGLPMRNPPPGTFGNGEIRVVGSNGLTYIAPVLVLHYVEAHNYLPPQEFIAAVLAAQGRAGA